MLGDNLIMSHQVNYMSSAPFPAEAVENNQEHLVAMKGRASQYWFSNSL